MMIAGAAYHASLGASLLRLEKDGLFVAARGASLVGARELSTSWKSASSSRDKMMRSQYARPQNSNSPSEAAAIRYTINPAEGKTQSDIRRAKL
jgi:hypothetical protein